MTRLPNLHQTLPACAIALAASACGSGGDATNAADGRGREASELRQMAGHLGPVTYIYDAAVLKPASVRIALAPNEDAPVYGVKLLPSRGVDAIAARCPDGERGCSLEAQPGVTLALLERPFARYEEALRTNGRTDGLRPATVAGAAGIAFRLPGEDNVKVEYRLAPVAGRALLIKLQSGGQNAAEDRALAQAIASIDLGG